MRIFLNSPTDDAPRARYVRPTNLRRRSAQTGLAVIVASLALGCTASIDGDPAGGISAVGGSAGLGGPGTTGSAGIPAVFPPDPMGQPQGAGPRPLTRLTQRQYVNVVDALLGPNTADAVVAKWNADHIGETGFVGILPNVSKLEARAYMEAAETFDQQSLMRLGQLATCATGADEVGCAKAFVQSFATKAYRRPLEATEVDELVAVYQAGKDLGYDYRKAIGLATQAILQSPFFLYQWELGARPAHAQNGLVALTGQEVASRLAFTLWGGLPDDELTRAANAGELSTPEAVSLQAERMLGDEERSLDTLWDFYVQWLYLKSTPALLTSLKKNPQDFPEFNAELAASMVSEAKAFLRQVVLKDSGSLSDLATSPWSLIDGPTASIYGVTGPAGGALVRTDLPKSQRSGLFTQPLFLSALSSDGGTLPPRMGKTLWTRMLCGPMGAIPAKVPDVKPPAPNLTTRERFAEHSTNPCAVGCHRILDPLGFSFENYDAIGRYRTQEGDRPIDATGALDLPSGKHIVFSNAVELLAQLATSDDLSQCFADQMFRYSLGRNATEADAGTPASVRNAFKNSNLNVKQLLLALVSSKSFLYRTPAEGEVVQ